MIRAAIKKHPVVAYYILAFSIVLLVVTYWNISAVIYQQLQGKPLDLFALVYRTYEELGYDYINLVATLHIFVHYPLIIPALCFGLAPTIAAFIVVSVSSGAKGCKVLISRLRPFGKSTSKKDIAICYGTITLVTFLLFAVFLYAQTFTAEASQIERSHRILGLDSVFAFFAAFLVGALLDEGGLLEELGWRGYLLPLLVDKLRNPLLASIAIGALWAAWHLPREITLLFTEEGNFIRFLLKQLEVFSSGIAVSIIITFFVIKAGGSVLPAIMIHGLANFLNKTFYSEDMPTLINAFSFHTTVEVLLAIIVVCVAGSQLGMRDKPALWRNE